MEMFHLDMYLLNAKHLFMSWQASTFNGTNNWDIYFHLELLGTSKLTVLEC